jgi:single-stranded-DNA-specific exonuclease
MRSVHLDRLTVESVRRLDQLAPYGADNPSPVFVLEMAVVEGVYAVSEGKHCRLRLRQGNSSIYAVWFGMHPEQVPYSTGDVAFRSTIRPVAHSCRAASSSCTRRASATQLQSRPRWCRRCAGVRP